MDRNVPSCVWMVTGRQQSEAGGLHGRTVVTHNKTHDVVTRQRRVWSHRGGPNIADLLILFSLTCAAFILTSAHWWKPAFGGMRFLS